MKSREIGDEAVAVAVGVVAVGLVVAPAVAVAAVVALAFALGSGRMTVLLDDAAVASGMDVVAVVVAISCALVVVAGCADALIACVGVGSARGSGVVLTGWRIERPSAAPPTPTTAMIPIAIGRSALFFLFFFACASLPSSGFVVVPSFVETRPPVDGNAPGALMALTPGALFASALTPDEDEAPAAFGSSSVAVLSQPDAPFAESIGVSAMLRLLGATVAASTTAGRAEFGPVET